MMANCPSAWAVVIIALLLATGCRPLHSNRAASRDDSTAADNRFAEPDDRDQQKAAKAHAHFSAGVIHELNDENEAALKEYYAAALGDLDNESLVLDVSRRFLVLKETNKALELLSRAAQQPSASGEIFVRLAVVYSQLGKPEQAVTACRTAIKRSPTSISGYQALFVVYLQAQKSQEAFGVLDEAAKQQKVGPEFLIPLADLYAKFGIQAPGQRESAKAKGLAVLARAEQLAGDSSGISLAMADTYNLLGDSDKAAQMYQRLLKKLPDVPAVRDRVRARLTEIYLRKDDRKQAAQQLQEIVREDPTNPQAYYFLGSIAFEDKKYSEAEELFQKALLLNPDLEQAYYDLASSQLNQGKTSDALATLDKSRAKFQPNFPMEFLSGMAFSRQKGFTEAMRHFISAEVIARATDPTRLNEYFYFQLGATCERKGDFEDAEKYLQQAIKIAPNFSEAQNYLGYMWADRGVNLDEAQDLIEKALKAEPENPAYLDSLGWALYKLKKPSEALELLLKAVKFSEEPDATLFDHLGDIYKALDQQEKAREAWKKSLEIEPDDQIQKKLDSTQGG